MPYGLTFAVPSNLAELAVYPNAKHTALMVESHNLELPAGPSETPEDNFQHLQSKLRAAELLQWFFAWFFL